MFCPACGSTNTIDQRFCRKCGMNLESTVESLREWAPIESDDLARRERFVEHFGQFAFAGFGLVLLISVIGLIYTIIVKMILAGDQPWAGVILVNFLVFAVLALGYVVYKEDLKERRKKARPAPPNELESPGVTGKLLEQKEFEPIPTVIEDTTDLLPVRDRER